MTPPNIVFDGPSATKAEAAQKAIGQWLDLRAATAPHPSRERTGAGEGRGGGAVKERPILFSGPMVRAILDGRKTQTRRVVRFAKGRGPESAPMAAGGQDPPYLCDELWNCHWLGDPHLWAWAAEPGGCTCKVAARAPTYTGGQLWVREAWAEFPSDGDYVFRADYDRDPTLRHNLKWKPSIFMPRAACRLRLEVTGVRVERLQAITEADAVAEGIGEPPWPGGTAAERYGVLWDSINAERAPWESNPWVWVVEFRKAPSPVAAGKGGGGKA